MRFCFLTPVWGRAYIDEYAEFSIPTLLAPNNIPALAATADVTYRVMTTTADARHLRQTAAFKRLSELVTVDIVRIDDLDKSNPTHAMSQAYIRGLRKSIRRNDIAFFIVTPDQIFADGAITGLARPVLDEGKRAVMSDGIRLASEGTKPILDREFRSKAGDTIAVPPRELAGIMTEYLHPISESRLYDSDRHNEYPGILYWRVDDEGILVRSFHPHPFVIYPRIKRAEFRSTIDHDYVLEVCPHGDHAQKGRGLGCLLGEPASPPLRARDHAVSLGRARRALARSSGRVGQRHRGGAVDPRSAEMEATAESPGRPERAASATARPADPPSGGHGQAHERPHTSRASATDARAYLSARARHDGGAHTGRAHAAPVLLRLPGPSANAGAPVRGLLRPRADRRRA
jgi:hypothetical protein